MLCAVLLEYANVGQIYRIWTEHTAAGQNITSWIAVNLALWLYLNFYATLIPEQKFARWATTAGLVLNFVLIFSIAWWRYIVH